jgi:hypothetical protein
MKKTSLFTLTLLFLSPLVFADFVMKIPLELDRGGHLPNNAIIISSLETETPVIPEEPVPCTFNSTTFYAEYNADTYPYKKGNVIAQLNGSIIGYNLYGFPTNMPAGIQKGNHVITQGTTDIFEICSKDLNSYPTVAPEPGSWVDSENYWNR